MEDNFECEFCIEGNMNVGEKTKYGAVIIYKMGDKENGWFATLSPKTGGDVNSDFSVQIMPISHIKYFSDLNNEELAKNYGIIFGKISHAVGELVKSKEENKIPVGVYGKCKHSDEHIHIKIFPYRNEIGQPFTVDSSFGKKEIFSDESGENYVKMKPVEKKRLSEKRLKELSEKLINILN